MKRIFSLGAVALCMLVFVLILPTAASAGWFSNFFQPRTPVTTYNPLPHINAGKIKANEIKIEANRQRYEANATAIQEISVNTGLTENNSAAIQENTIQISGINTEIQELRESAGSSSEQPEFPAYANGTEIGLVTFDTTYDGQRIALLEFNKDFEPVILTATGDAHAPSGNIYYTESNCQGTTYFLFSEYPVSESNLLIPPPKGKVFVIDGERYYYPPNMTAVYVKSVYSYRSYDNCYSTLPANRDYLINTDTNEIVSKSVYSGWPHEYYDVVPTFDDPVGILKAEWREATQEEIEDHYQLSVRKVLIELLPNDPAITGLPNGLFQPPITIGGMTPLTVIE